MRRLLRREELRCVGLIGMAYNVAEAIRVLYQGRAVPAQGPIPQDIAGYDAKLRTNAQLYDPGAARALLDKFGYKDRNGEGYRQAPDGKALVIEYWTPLPRRRVSVTSSGRKHGRDRPPARGEERQAAGDNQMARQGQIPVSDGAWIADYPDGENFMQLLYGPNAGQV